MNRKRVYVVDEKPAATDPLAERIRAMGYQVVQYSKAKEFLDAVDPTEVCCAILKLLPLGDLSGLHVLQTFRQNAAICKVVLWAYDNDRAIARASLNRGAVEYLVAPVTNEKLAEVVQKALLQAETSKRLHIQPKARLEQVEKVLNSKPIEEKIVEPASGKLIAAARKLNLNLSQLKPRELEVLDYVIQGFTSKVIGQRLGISHRTADAHRSNGLRKLGLKSMADLRGLLSELITKD